MAKVKFCKKCNDNHEEMCNGFFEWLQDDCYECPIKQCKSQLVDLDISMDDFDTLCKISKDTNFIFSMIKLKEDNIIDYELKMSQFRANLGQQKSSSTQPSQPSTTSQSNQITCPKCGSTSITEGTKGFSLLTGFVGSSNFRYVCKNCGNKWKPGSMLETLQRVNNGN